MPSISASSFLSDLNTYKNDPVRIRQAMLDVFDAVNGGTIDVVDSTNPFVFALGACAFSASAFMAEDAALTRKQYASSAVDESDLYPHMSDRDWVGRFSMPSTANFTIALDYNELKNGMVDELVDGRPTGVKKITIPRNTSFLIAGTTFSLSYPIDIRQLPHTGLQIVYINTKPSPLQVIETQRIDFDFVRVDAATEYLRFQIPALQFKIETRYNTVTQSAGYYHEFEIEDDFCMARVYLQDAAGVWNELQVTYTQEILSVTTPTVLVKVFGKKIGFTVPIIYVNSGLILGKLRMDAYHTKGAINMRMESHGPGDFMANWKSIDENENNNCVTATLQIKNLYFVSTDHVIGGRGPLSFQELRQRILTNAIGPQQLPITNAQVRASVQDLGYSVLTNIDSLTNRVFLASRPVIPPTSTSILTSACTSMLSTRLTFSEARSAPGVYDHTDAICLSPKTLYKLVNGITSVVGKVEHDALMASPPSEMARMVNASNYFFSPFHYVFDASGQNFEVRPYYLDNPYITKKEFVDENITTGYQATLSKTYGIYKTDTGYKLFVKTSSTKSFKELPNDRVHAQLRLISVARAHPVFLMGKLESVDPLDMERTYSFDITSNFYVDANHRISLTSFRDNATATEIVADLTQGFDVYLLMTAPTTGNAGYRLTTMDTQVNTSLLQDGTTNYVLSHQIITIKFGDFMSNLWCQSRSIAQDIPYETYPTNVQAVYEADVYDTFPGGKTFKIEQGKIVYAPLIHRAGDAKFNPDGTPAWSNLKGEVKLDVNKKPKLATGFESNVERIADIFVIEGVYFFTTEMISTNYRQEIISALVNWIISDLTTYTASLLEQTKIFFYPQINAGSIRVLASDNTEATIDSAQSLKLKLHVTPLTYNDPKLCEALVRLSVQHIEQQFQQSMVSTSSIETDLRDKYQDNVLNVELAGVTGVSGYSVVTVLDESSRLGLKKKLVAQPNGILTIEEDVTVQFVAHGKY